MIVTVLGCGSSTGVPVIGGNWGRCDPTNPKNRRRRAAILVEHGDTNLLVDTPPDLRDQCLDADVRRVDAVLYTHAHADHTHGIDELRVFNVIHGGPIDVYGDAPTLDEISSRFAYAFGTRVGEGPWYRPALTANVIAPDVPFSVAGCLIRPFAQIHGHLRSLGFRFGDFAYSTDASDFSEDAFAALAGIDTWLVDCVRYEPAPGHAHLERTLGWIERVRPRRAILTHMASEFDYQTLLSELPAGVEPAYDGMRLEFPDPRA